MAHRPTDFLFSPPDLIHVHTCPVFNCYVRGLYELTICIIACVVKHLGRPGDQREEEGKHGVCGDVHF